MTPMAVSGCPQQIGNGSFASSESAAAQGRLPSFVASRTGAYLLVRLSRLAALSSEPPIQSVSLAHHRAS
jgi:hypothetical protein